MNKEDEFQRAIDAVSRFLSWVAVAVVAYVALMIAAAVWVQA